MSTRSTGCRRRDLASRSEEHTSELQSHSYLVCRLLLEKKKKKTTNTHTPCRHTTQTNMARNSYPVVQLAVPVWSGKLFSFFFLMIRRPPRSTLFPSRRSSDLVTWH